MKTKKLVLLVMSASLLSGCSALTDKMKKLEELAKSAASRDKKSFDKKTKKTIIHECDLTVTKAREWTDTAPKYCTLQVMSQVKDVTVAQKGSRFSSNASLWQSAKETKEIKLKNCDDIELWLSKKYYNPHLCSASFDNGDRATLALSESDWLKYGYVRVDYSNGDASRVEVEGLPNKEVIVQGNTHSQKVELGDYTVTITAPHKVTEKVAVAIDGENAIKLIDVGTEAPKKLIELDEKEVELNHGRGTLLVVTEKNNANFTIKRKGEKSSKHKAPMQLGLAAGEYTITYKGQTKPLTVKHQKEHKVVLGKYINMAD